LRDKRPCGDIQKDWNVGQSARFNKSKCWVLHLELRIASQRYRLRDKCLESSAAEMGLDILVNSRLNMSQQCALAAKEQTQFWHALNTA